METKNITETIAYVFSLKTKTNEINVVLIKASNKDTYTWGYEREGTRYGNTEAKTWNQGMEHLVKWVEEQIGVRAYTLTMIRLQTTTTIQSTIEFDSMIHQRTTQ